MNRIFISEEQYKKVRHVEHVSGHDIKDIYAPIVDYADGYWGVWNIMSCYQSGNIYIADVILEQKASGYEEAVEIWTNIKDMALTQYRNGDSSIEKNKDLN